MTNPKLFNRKENQSGSGQTVCSRANYALIVFQRMVDPDRKRWRKTDVRFAKYLVEVLASALASGGPKSLDEVVQHDHYRLEELPAFPSESGSIGDWRNSSAFVSDLSSILISLIDSRDPAGALYSDMFETLGMLAYLETRIAKVVETLE